MNTLLKDRNTLKRLVESYGKQDVLNFVRRLNENTTLSKELLDSFKTSVYLGLYDLSWYLGGQSIIISLGETILKGSYLIDDIKIVGNKLVLSVSCSSYGVDEDDETVDDFLHGLGKSFLVIAKTNYSNELADILDNISEIETDLYFDEHDVTVKVPCEFLSINDIQSMHPTDRRLIDIDLQSFAISKFGEFAY